MASNFRRHPSAIPVAGWLIPDERAGGSGAEAALPAGVVAEGAQEVDLAESRPQGFAEVELAVRALPHQEPGQALLPGRSDHQVRIRLAARIQEAGNIVDGQRV